MFGRMNSADDRDVKQQASLLVGDYTASVGDVQAPIDIRIRGVRAFIVTVILMATLGAITYLLIEGFTISTFDATTLTDKKKTALLNRYNTYSGSIASIVSMPFQQFAVILLPVFFLCFTTKAILSENKSLLEQWAPILGAIAISWVLSQGLNAVNVQFDSPKVELIIAVDDLAASNANSTFDLEMSNVTSTTKLAGNPSNNTILRSAIRSISRSFDSTCTDDGGRLSNHPEASVRFGFPLSSWFENMLPESVAAEKSYSFSMSDTFSARSVESAVFPGGDINKTAVLFSYGIYTLWMQFGDSSYGNVSSIDAIYTDVKSSDPATMLTKMQTKIANASDELKIRKSTEPWINVSVPEIAVEFSNTQLAPQISFEAVTFTLPIKMQTMKDWLYQPKATDIYYSMGTYLVCNDYACVLQTPNTDGTLQDQVRLLRLCMTNTNSTDEDLKGFNYKSTCRHISNSSVLIYSLSRHIEAAEANYNISKSDSQLTLKNPRKIFKVTLGRLSWATEDLAQAYGAQCTAGMYCRGLRFPLSNGQQHLVVGASHLPSPHTLLYPGMFDEWQILVLANTQSYSNTQGDIIYPPNYSRAKGTPAWANLSGSNCSYQGADYINDVLYRHIYSHDPLQVAYTAGMFWLFQNSAVKNVEVLETATPSAANVVPLAFGGNRMWISPRVSIPLTSACITFGGCALILILGLLVIVWSSNPERQSTLTGQLSAHNVAGVLVDTKQYPPFLVQAAVHSEIDSKFPATSQDGERDESIHEFVIADMRLKHRSSDPVRSVAIGRERNGLHTQTSMYSF